MKVVDVVAVGLGESFETFTAHEEDLNFRECFAGRDVSRFLQQRLELVSVLEEPLLFLQRVDVVTEDHFGFTRIQHVKRYPHFRTVQQIRFGPRHSIGWAVEEVIAKVRVIVHFLFDEIPIAVL